MKSVLLDYLLYHFALSVEYQYDGAWSHLTADQFWAMLVEQICVMHVSLRRNLLSTADFILRFNVWSLHIPLNLGARMMYLMDVFHNYRWLVILVERLKASAVRVAVDLSSHRHHRRICTSWWPCRLNYFACWSKGNKISHANSMEDRMLNPRVTRSSLVPNLHFSAELMTHWMLMLGSVQSIPSLLC